MSDWHDVENNLAFPPRENITSNNLTDDWKAGRLDGEFWIKLSKPTGEYIERKTFVKGALHEEKDPCVEIVEVLAPCDYDHFHQLEKKVKELEKDIQTLTNNYKLLEKKQASDIAHGQALVDEFGDFEALYEELQRLRKIAAKYDRMKVKDNYPDKISQLKSRIKHLLELQANHDKEVERLRAENATLNKVFETDFDILLSEVANAKQKNKKIKQLREVLHECRPALSHLGKWNTQRQYLLTRINEALNV